MKSITVIQLPTGKGKTSIALTEFHRYKLQNESVGFAIPMASDKRHTLPLAKFLGVDIEPHKIITNLTSVRGVRFDRLIVDDIDVYSHKIKMATGYIYDMILPYTERVLITTTDGMIVRETQSFCDINGIKYNVYFEKDLVNYKVGYRFCYATVA